jgi:hypothetical protein
MISDLIQIALLVALFFKSKPAWLLLIILTSFFFGTLSRGSFELLRLPFYYSFSKFFAFNKEIIVYWATSLIILLFNFHRDVIKFLGVSRGLVLSTIVLVIGAFLIGISILVE